MDVRARAVCQEWIMRAGFDDRRAGAEGREEGIERVCRHTRGSSDGK